MSEEIDDRIERMRTGYVAERAVIRLWNDINGRKGFDLRDLDEDIQHEILDEWILALQAEYGK